MTASLLVLDFTECQFHFEEEGHCQAKESGDIYSQGNIKPRCSILKSSGVRYNIL